MSGRPKWFPEEFNWVVGCTYKGMPLTTSPVRNPIGANMSFRRWVVQELGGFRADIGRVGTTPLGDEETEFSIRVSQRWPQHVVLYEPRARVHHRVPAARARFGYFCSRCYFEGVGKARVALLVGARDGLASERTYALRTLPAGVAGGLVDAVLHFEFGGAARAGAIILGLAITAAGYVRARVALSLGRASRPAGPEVQPVQVRPGR